MPAAKGSRSSSKKAKKTGSNVFDMFTQKQVAEFKEGFQIMDRDRDGVIDKADLRGTFDEIGRMVSDSDLDAMLADAPGPINFTTLLHMFASRSSGEADDDDVSPPPSAPSRRTRARSTPSSSARCSWPSVTSSPARRSTTPSTRWTWTRTPA
ncbi:myosin light chain 2 [Penaeus vannamei]|uniref:Myosin light chain 2 n=1 Tax=Penaeus vannamei TaxID=6689 RepID=A0A3R7LUL9_PENVA|nr:myosin light chain 2 [Penaeus vannamei]